MSACFTHSGTSRSRAPLQHGSARPRRGGPSGGGGERGPQAHRRLQHPAGGDRRPLAHHDIRRRFGSPRQSRPRCVPSPRVPQWCSSSSSDYLPFFSLFSFSVFPPYVAHPPSCYFSFYFFLLVPSFRFPPWHSSSLFFSLLFSFL